MGRNIVQSNGYTGYLSLYCRNCACKRQYLQCYVVARRAKQLTLKSNRSGENS